MSPIFYILDSLILDLQFTADTDECFNNPCSHGATCRNTIGGYICECAKGWTGPQCKIDDNECSRGPCMNGARCENTLGSFQCICLEGWTGPLCDQGRYKIFFLSLLKLWVPNILMYNEMFSLLSFI